MQDDEHNAFFDRSNDKTTQKRKRDSSNHSKPMTTEETQVMVNWIGIPKNYQSTIAPVQADKPWLRLQAECVPTLDRFTTDQLKKRWSNLKAKYGEAKKQSKQSGWGIGEDGLSEDEETINQKLNKICWGFYPDLERILCDNPSFEPPSTGQSAIPPKEPTKSSALESDSEDEPTGTDPDESGLSDAEQDERRRRKVAREVPTPTPVVTTRKQPQKKNKSKPPKAVVKRTAQAAVGSTGPMPTPTPAVPVTPSPYVTKPARPSTSSIFDSYGRVMAESNQQKLQLIREKLQFKERQWKDEHALKLLMAQNENMRLQLQMQK
ncbi:hypothetical protein HDU93_001709 [Gonapodya sp. JEL0774]|nr:hypothetical protein HDU93_001709 [Gonapodya sp. JEL0774]